MNEREIFNRLEEFIAVPQREDTEYSKACEARDAKYGFNEVSANYCDTTFDSLVLPALADFTLLKKSCFAKHINEDIFHVIKFERSRGSYVFQWGVSLSYVPHEWEEKNKFHRTLKSARFDLYDSVQSLTKDCCSSTVHLMASFLHGEECFREELATAWNNLEPVIRNWFAATATLDGVLNTAKAQMNSPANEHSSAHYKHQHPRLKMIYAFTLAKMGKFEEGLVVLEELMKSNSQFYSAPELPKALRQIAKFE